MVIFHACHENGIFDQSPLPPVDMIFQPASNRAHAKCATQVLMLSKQCWKWVMISVAVESSSNGIMGNIQKWESRHGKDLAKNPTV